MVRYDLKNGGYSKYIPEVAIQFNGEWLDDGIRQYQTLTVSGRETFEYRVEASDDIPGRDGAILRSKHIPARELRVRYVIKAEDNEEFQYVYRRFLSMLESEDNVPIKFRDEMDVTYYGQVVNYGEVPSNLNTVVGEFTIICPDPYKYKDEKSLSGNPLVVASSSPYKAHPDTLTVTLGSDTQRVTIENQTTGDKMVFNGNYSNGSEIKVDIDGKTATNGSRNIKPELDYTVSAFHEFWVHDGDVIAVTPTSADLAMVLRERWK